MPYRTKTSKATRQVTKTRDVVKNDRLGYNEIEVHRPKIIFFEFQGMRPSTPHWIFFGNNEVNKYCNTSYTLSDYTSAARNSKIKEPGDSYVSENTFPASLGGASNGGASEALVSGADGSLKGFFYLQSNVTTNYRLSTDGNSFSALDISVLNQNEALSYASSKFYGMAQYENWYEYTVSETKEFSETYTKTELVYYAESNNTNDNDTSFSPFVSVSGAVTTSLRPQARPWASHGYDEDPIKSSMTSNYNQANLNSIAAGNGNIGGGY